MPLEIDENNLKEGLLGLVIALLEIIIDTLEVEALKRVEAGSLEDEEINQLGEALLELDQAIINIKKEHGLVKVVQDVKDGLNELVDDVVDRMINPYRWEEELGEKEGDLS